MPSVANSALGTGSLHGRPPDPQRFRSWQEYAVALSAYVADQAKVAEAVQPQAVQLVHIDTTGQLARVVTDGLMVYDPVRRGVMVSIAGEWLPLYAGIAYGGMRYDGPGLAVPDITNTWQQVRAFNAQPFPPFDMVFDVTNDWFTFERPGLYQVNLGFSFEHNNAGQARELEMRFRNIDNGSLTPIGSVATGSGDRVTNVSGATQFLIYDPTLNTRTVLEARAGTGQTYSAVIVQSLTITAARLNYAF